MTSHSIYRIWCDGPGCDASDVVEGLRDVPEGWRRISSVDHLDPADYPIVKTVRRRTIKTNLYDHTHGSFVLHVCPDHLAAFDEHLPRTRSQAYRESVGHGVNIGCSCGTRVAWDYDIILVGEWPRLRTHLKWWQHLSAELGSYVMRERARERKEGGT